MSDTPKNADPRALHAVEVLSPECFIGSTTYLAGDVVEVSAARAKVMHRDGIARVLEPARIDDLPDPPLPACPAVPHEPYPNDPRVLATVISGTLFVRDRSHVKGDEVSLPERLAVEHLLLGSISLAAGMQLSDRGKKYRDAIRDTPQANPAY